MNISHKKIILIFAEFFALFVYTACFAITENRPAPSNALNWVEVSQGKFSTQIMFDFSQPIFFEKKLNKEKFRLKLTFLGMNLEQFKSSYVINQLNKLKQLGLLEHVALFEKDQESKKIILSLDFAQHAHKRSHKKGSVLPEQKNKLLIKWATLEGPNRLIIDIFTEQKLNELKKQGQILLQAHNDAVASDMTQKFSYSKQQPTGKDFRIVIDAGHGGSQPGAQCFGYQEKTFALDIAQRVRKQLKQAGFNALLTRSTDTTLSLVQRSELAAQLKADLFVSIHVNATGKRDPAENGIETFYLDHRFIFPSAQKSGFILMNLHHQNDLPATVSNVLRKNLQASRDLASTIQHNLVSSLQAQKINVINRGVKSDGFRVLLRSGVPAALVEVGFITNKQEASRLAQEQYRTLVARGICQGVEKYVTAQH